MAGTVYQNKNTGDLFISPEAALEKYTKNKRLYDMTEYWILPVKGEIVVVLKRDNGTSNWSIFFQLHITQIQE